MNREDIIRIAREVGIVFANHTAVGSEENLLQNFAALVAAAEREACAKIADRQLHNMNALLVYPMQSSAAYEIGCAIRARGKE